MIVPDSRISWFSWSQGLQVNLSWLIFFPLIFKLNFFFHFYFFNIKLFDNWSSWFYSICFQTQLLWYHDWVNDFAYWPRWAWIEFFQPCLYYTFFLKFSPSTFYFLKIELHLFSFHFFLWSYNVLIWFIKNWPSNIFSCVFFLWNYLNLISMLVKFAS